MTLILHIAPRDAWQQRQEAGLYRAPGLDEDGFVHCSTPAQVVSVANRIFAGHDALVLLCIESERLAAELVYEDCYEEGERFPHVYGPINLDAVAAVLPFEADERGRFSLPPALATSDAANADEPQDGAQLSAQFTRAAYPILEFDRARTALIEPHELLDPLPIAEHCVLCFFQDVIGRVMEESQLEPVWELGSEIGANPVYELDLDGRRLVVCHPGVGAPLAAAFMDELIALGCRKFIACGGAGVVAPELALGHVVVPSAAVRDEGTSYHYMPPSREVTASPEAVVAIEGLLQEKGVPYVVGKTWTTDAIYRETPARIAARRAEGCLTVEMETAAFYAVANFRGVTAGQLLYGGDDVSGDVWDARDWQREENVREQLFWLAAEACLSL